MSEKVPLPGPPPRTGEGAVRPSIATVTLRGVCPACGKGKLFKNRLEIADYCHSCGLSFKAHEQGDGPAFLGVLLIGALTAIGAAVTEVKYSPPFWVHAVVWIPFIFIGSLVSLRLMKALIIGVQYQYRKEDFV